MKDVMLIIHFLGLAMGAGAAFGFIFLNMAAAKLERSESRKFILNSFSLGRMGNIGIILSFISGGYLMTPYWKTLGSTPLLILKLILFLVLAAIFGIIGATAKKARKGDPDIHLKKGAMLSQLAFATAILIIVFAVLVFH